MNLTWSARLIKHMLFAFNVIFVITGIAILAVGVSVKAYYYEYSTFLDTKYFSLPNLLIATGIIIFIISFFGCYGAYKSSWFLIFVFSCLLVLVFIFELSAGIAGYVLRDKTAAYLEETLQESQKYYGNDSATAKIWDLVQRNFECCGTDDAKDWEDVFHNQSLPLSCCPSTNGIIDGFYCNSNSTIVTSTVLTTVVSSSTESTASSSGSSTASTNSSSPLKYADSNDTRYNPSTTSPYGTGCSEAFGDFVRNHAIDLGAAGIVLAVIQVLGIGFSCYLCRKLKHSYYST